MVVFIRWFSLCCVCLIGIFFAHSVIGESTTDITAEGAEFSRSELLGGSTEFQRTIFEILPSFVTGRNSEFVKQLALIMPNRALAESSQPHILVHGATFVRYEYFSDPRISQSELKYCQTGLGYDTIEALKDNLEEQAKQAAATELLNTQVISITAEAGCSPTEDDIAALLTDFIGVSEDPIYSNDQTMFAGVCISIFPYVEGEKITELDLAQIADDVCRGQ